LLLSGCGASGQQFKAEASKPDRALLYVYRPSTLIGIGNADVPFLHLDGRRLARIRIGGYLAIPISPGRHKLTTTMSLLGNDTGKIRGEATVAAPVGATIYLRYTEGFKAIVPIPLPVGVVVVSSANYVFEFVPEAEALAELASTQALELVTKLSFEQRAPCPHRCRIPSWVAFGQSLRSQSAPSPRQP
jgi:hypothetical protein